MKEALLVATGGAAGALFRYFMVLLFARFHVSSLFAVWVVNVSGSFALGLLLSLALSRTTIPPSLQLLAGVGFLGSYTTIMITSFPITQQFFQIPVLSQNVSFRMGFEKIKVYAYWLQSYLNP